MAGVGVPVFGEPVGAGVLFGSAEQGWRLLDLDSGRLREVPALDGVAARPAVRRPQRRRGTQRRSVRAAPVRASSGGRPGRPFVVPPAGLLARYRRPAGPGRRCARRRARRSGVGRRQGRGRRLSAPDEVLATLVGLDGQRLIGPITCRWSPRRPPPPGSCTRRAGGATSSTSMACVTSASVGCSRPGVGRRRVVCNADARCVPRSSTSLQARRRRGRSCLHGGRDRWHHHGDLGHRATSR